MKKIILKDPLTSFLILIGFWVVIILFVVYVFIPVFGGSKEAFDGYPDYESECVPNYLGGCDPI